LRVGHRGARAYEPENTLRSFERALELGVDAVEFDVRRTRDDEVVVIHDARVDRTTDGKGSVREMTIQQIKQLVLEKDEKIPTLEEALDFLDKKVKIVIELKENGLEKKVLSSVREKGLEKNLIIVSFLEKALSKVRELDDGVETGLIYVRHRNPIQSALKLGAKYLLPFYRFTHASNVEKAHENGLKVIVWTVNDPEEVSKYVRMGVDGIASDKPDILRTA